MFRTFRFSIISIILIFSVLAISGCIQQQEIRLDMSCENASEACSAACIGNYSAELDAWRCSADGRPVCICKAYKDSGQFIG